VTVEEFVEIVAAAVVRQTLDQARETAERA
jgi:hypothetical protein